jgi:hypothetical protein
MFSATPDGTYLFEIKRLRDKYGYPDKVMKDIKILNISVSANEFTQLGSKNLFRLKVDRSEKKIFLCVFDRNINLVDKMTFWSFELLEEKLRRKMQTLAVVDTAYKKEINEVYYKYQNITFYNLKNFDSFIDTIESGSVRVTFKISTFRDGKRYGQIHDHGTSFDIKEIDLEKIYEIIPI